MVMPLPTESPGPHLPSISPAHSTHDLPNRSHLFFAALPPPRLLGADTLREFSSPAHAVWPFSPHAATVYQRRSGTALTHNFRGDANIEIRGDCDGLHEKLVATFGIRCWILFHRLQKHYRSAMTIAGQLPTLHFDHLSGLDAA